MPLKSVVNGGFSNWSDWTECSVTCANGQNTRTRSCDSPAPLRGGDPCDGEVVQYRDCTEMPCPGEAVSRVNMVVYKL